MEKAGKRQKDLTHNNEEDPNGNLEEEGDTDEGSQGGIILEGVTLFQDRLQLRGVGHEERHIQHALRYTLLCGIMVDVDGVFAPGARIRCLEQKGDADDEEGLNQATMERAFLVVASRMWNFLLQEA